MKCPNCDFIDKDELFGDPAICPKCSAIYEKALRVKQIKNKIESQKAGKSQQREAQAKSESWIAKHLKAAAGEIKAGRARRKSKEFQTLYTEDGAPVLVRADKKAGGYLKPMVIFAGALLLIALFSASKTSYNEYIERANDPKLAIEKSSAAAEKSKASDDDMRRIKIQRMAREGIKARLYDPDSAKFRNQRGACGEVNSKNLFGAYTGYKRFMYGGSEIIFIEDDSEFAEGGFDDAWERLCTGGGKLAF